MIKKEFFSWRNTMYYSNFKFSMHIVLCYTLFQNDFQTLLYILYTRKRKFHRHQVLLWWQWFFFIEYWYMLTWIVLIREFWSKFTIVKYNIQFLEIYRFIIQRRISLYQHFDENCFVLVMNFIILRHQVIPNVLQIIKRLKMHRRKIFLACRKNWVMNIDKHAISSIALKFSIHFCY